MLYAIENIPREERVVIILLYFRNVSVLLYVHTYLQITYDD